MKLPIGVQLYTVREETNKDFIGTLEKVSALGYDGVEFAGYGDLDAKELKAHLVRLNLKVAGCHHGLEDLLENIQAIMKYNEILGNNNIICCYSHWNGNKAELLEIAKQLKTIAVQCKENGFNFFYHNHDHEFDEIEGEHGLDLLYNMIPEDELKIELDTHWVERANLEPVEFMKKYGSRCELIHLKDMIIEDGEKTYAPVGSGIMDIKSIIDTAEEIGTKWLIVENDDPKPDGMTDITASIQYLKKL